MKKSLILLFCALMIPAIMWGQATAQMHGVVQDMSGASVPGAMVKATQTDTGLSRTATSEADGSFVLTNLAPGPYRVEATKEGFSTTVQNGVELQVGSDPALAFSMKVGAVTESVNVEATATQVETRAQGVSAVVETQRVLDLPLNGRNITDLIPLSGASNPTTANGTYDMHTGVTVSIAGSQGYSVQYYLDGASYLDTYTGASMPLPFPDAMQEFKLSTSAQDASGGGHSGASVSAVTKSGTNSLHGDAFEFFRNSDLNAKGFFAVAPDGQKRNQIGGVFGGPIKKDKLFFFLGYQGTFLRTTPVDASFISPTPAMLTGNFAAYIAAGCGTFGAGALTSTGQLVQPVSPAAVKLSSYLPPPINACGQAYNAGDTHENTSEGITRIDYQFSPKQSFFARYVVEKDVVIQPGLIVPTVINDTGVADNNMANDLTLGDTYIVNSSVVNSFRIFGNRTGLYIPSGKAPFTWASLGVDVTQCGGPCAGFFYLNVTSGPSLGSGRGAMTNGGYTNFGLNDDITWIKGSHQFAFGGFYMKSEIIEDSYAWAFGGATFTGLTVAQGGTGNGLGDFIAGDAQSFRQDNGNPNDTREHFFGLYAADTWKATSRLTVNMGVRWNPYDPLSFINKDGTGFSLSNFYNDVRSTVDPQAPPGLIYYGDKGFNGSSALASKLGHFEPRLGFAFDPFGDGKTAIRGGGGIAYDFIKQDDYQNVEDSSPFKLNITTGPTSFDNPWGVIGGNPFPYTYKPGTFPTYVNYQTFLPLNPNSKTTEQYSYNLQIQRQITPSVFASATFLGTHLIHVWTGVDLNPAVFIPGNCQAGQYGLTAPGPCSTLANENNRLLLELTNPTAPNVNLFGSVTEIDDGATEGYNALLMTSTWRKSNVNISGNFTWSHCIGLPATVQQAVAASYPHQAYQNNGPVDRNLDVGDCQGDGVVDYRKMANVTAVLNTPTFSNAWARRLLTGWTFSTIVQTRSGAALTPALGADGAINGLYQPSSTYPVPQRPVQVLQDTVLPTAGQSCPTAPCVTDLNKAAYASPALGTYGDAGVGSLRGPAEWEWDQTAVRRFNVRESQYLEFRVEAFGVTNSTSLGNPNVSFASSAFGRITSQSNSQRIMQIALKYVF